VGTLLLGITFIALGFLRLWRDIPYPSGTLLIYTDFLLVICFLVEGCVLIYRAILGNKHVLSNNRINKQYLYNIYRICYFNKHKNTVSSSDPSIWYDHEDRGVIRPYVVYGMYV